MSTMVFHNHVRQPQPGAHAVRSGHCSVIRAIHMLPVALSNSPALNDEQKQSHALGGLALRISRQKLACIFGMWLRWGDLCNDLKMPVASLAHAARWHAAIGTSILCVRPAKRGGGQCQRLPGSCPCGRAQSVVRPPGATPAAARTQTSPWQRSPPPCSSQNCL